MAHAATPCAPGADGALEEAPEAASAPRPFDGKGCAARMSRACRFSAARRDRTDSNNLALWDPFRLDPHMSTNVGFFMLRTNSASVPAIAASRRA